MSDYYITGKKAAIDGLECLRKFRIALRGTDTAAVCSSSDGAVLRGTGNADWAAVAVGYGLPVKYPGDLFTFTASDREGQGWTSAADGAIVSKVRIHCPITTGRFIYHELFIASRGSLTGGAYSASDASTPNPLSASGLAFHRNGSSVGGVEGWVFEIDGNITDPSWPSHMGGWPLRDAGNWDAKLGWTQAYDTVSALPSLHTLESYKLYVTDSTYYSINWMQMLSQPATYEIEGDPPGKPDYIKATPEVHFSGWREGTKGHIKKPGTSSLWPTA